MSSDNPQPAAKKATAPSPRATPPRPRTEAPRTPSSSAAVDGRRGGGGRGRGRGGGGRGGSHPSGRSPMAGRTLVPTVGGGGRGASGGGGTAAAASPLAPPHHESHNHQHQQHQPLSVHSSSGVPFGHVPAYLPGSSSLVEELDQRILIVLRDGKHLIGVSWPMNIGIDVEDLKRGSSHSLYHSLSLSFLDFY